MDVKKKNWEMGEGCEMWGGNEIKKWDRWGGMYVCGGGEEKRKAGVYMGGKEKKKEKKGRKNKWGVEYICMVGKKGEWKRNKKKKILKGKKLNWLYLYVHFVWCKMWNCENLFRGCLWYFLS